MDKAKYTDPHTKANILLQCHFSRMPIPVDLVGDQKVVVELATRLLSALVDVISSNSWMNPALAAMELAEMVTQGLWTKDSPLLQISVFNDSLVKACAAVVRSHLGLRLSSPVLCAST